MWLAPPSPSFSDLLDYRPFVLVQGVHQFLVRVQVVPYETWRNEGHPLAQRDVGEVVAPESLQESHRRLAGVLDVVAHRERHVAHIAGLVVEGTRVTFGREQGH